MRPLDPDPDPLRQFLAWFDEAAAAGVAEPEAVALATASPDGAPAVRMVLYRGLAGGRFTFYTSYRSRKARELDANPRAALAFHWREVHRQVRVEGRVERLSDGASDRYFAGRPRGSRISAWASAQSDPLADRAALERAWREAEARFAGIEVPRPPFWGGYGLRPLALEFWTGSDDRLHDRVRYERSGGGWRWTRLQP